MDNLIIDKTFVEKEDIEMIKHIQVIYLFIQNDDEINKFLIDDKLSDSQKIEYILKSGLPSQKLCVS